MIAACQNVPVQRAARPLPLNLMPWRQQRARRRRTRLLQMLVLPVLITAAGSAWVVFRFEQHTRQLAQQSALTQAQTAEITATLQRVQQQHDDLEAHRSAFSQTLHHFKRHAAWQGMLDYLDAVPVAIQISAMSATSTRLSLTGMSLDARALGDFQSAHHDLELVRLQLSADGWYGFELGREWLAESP